MTTAVLDIGKTNLKLLALDAAGAILAVRQRPNAPLPGPPWLHPDLAGIERWLAAELPALVAEHGVEAFVAASHGSGGVLVDADGPVVPAIDYEAVPPAEIDAAYARLVPDFPERSSAILGGASHFARQLLWMREAAPAAFARAQAFLPLPQYVAWRLTGTTAIDVTMLGAQSHLWSPLRGAFTALVDALGVRRLIPPVRPSHAALGPPLPRWGLPAGLRVLAGIHDSSANLYRYQRAGLEDLVLLSTGTWIVGMTPHRSGLRLDERRGMGLTSDVAGAPVAGVLAMTGREHGRLAPGGGAAELDAVAALVARGTMALPGFAELDGIHPKSAGRGRITGPEPADPRERRALAALYAALVAEACLELLGARRLAVIDGGFTADPLFAALIASLRPDLEVRVEPTGHGTAAGAALLATHGCGVAPALRLAPAERHTIAGLDGYRRRWRAAVEDHLTGEGP